MWGILTDVGIVIMRHFKDKNWYGKAHALTFIIIDFFTLGSVISMLVENSDKLSSIENDTVYAHYIMGLIFISILVF